MSTKWWLFWLAVALISVWYRSDTTPLTFGAGLILFLLLAASIAAAQDDFTRFSSLLLGTRGYPLTVAYKFWLQLGDRAWNLIGLTPEEVAVVKTSPPPAHIVLEQWGRSLIRYRVFTDENGELKERTTDLYAIRDPDITLWSVNLPKVGETDPDAPVVAGLPRVALSWRRGGELMLCAHWGRFGGWLEDPPPEHTLFRFKVPRRFAGSRVPDRHDPLADHLDPDQRESGHSTYSFEDREKGIRWWLGIYDLRPRLYGKIVRVHKKLRSREVTGFTAEVWKGVKLRADVKTIESGGSESRPPRRGDDVELVLDDYLGVDRAWVHSI